MLHPLIAAKTNAWFDHSDCPVRPLIAHMEKANFLRDAQIEAVKTYLFLKIAGQNRPLYQLFCDGFFTNDDLSTVALSEAARARLQADTPARALLAFSRQGELPLLPEVEKLLTGPNPPDINSEEVIKRLFYGVSYADYLFSLPMGAGKTFLMAAIICLDLYFAQNEPKNPAFAHNFLLMVPSALKSSILPSLKTIENFDPARVLPEPAASAIRKILRFEILDQAKSGSKSNKARNPNAQKIAQYQPFDDLMGLVLVTNAEKVVLDKVTLDSATGTLIPLTDEEEKQAENELRHFIGKLPHLQILIDEVHHVTKDENKLRGVVNRWASQGNINSVLGFSGTPYVSPPQKWEVAPDVSVKFGQITNTVYYYPLIRAVRTFLKKPQIKTYDKLTPGEIVGHGVDEFLKKYGDTVYENGAIAKLAIYCGTIKRLEEEIYPILLEKGIADDAILKYYSAANKDAYKLAPDADLQWRNLDTSLSRKRFILLVQIGKEGWDCRSLTGVVLSQSGDCPTNMVLQTGCRCLRQMDAPTNTAGIWLNQKNADILDKQLKEEQHTSIDEINQAGKRLAAPPTRPRTNRTDVLRLPTVPFYQMRVVYDTVIADLPNPTQTLADLRQKVQDGAFRRLASSTERTLTESGITRHVFHETEAGESADYPGFVRHIIKGGMGGKAQWHDLSPFEADLRALFAAITVSGGDGLRYNALFDRDALAAQVRLAFYAARTLNTKEETFQKNAHLLIAHKLSDTVAASAKNLYPDEAEAEQIIALDAAGLSAGAAQAAQQARYEAGLEAFRVAGLDSSGLPVPAPLPPAVQNKDRSFHYLPHSFDSSFERDFLERALALDALREKNLEIYFNGAGEFTEFRIMCYAKRGEIWSRVGEYTPDFLLVSRKNDAIYRALIIETKGKGFASDKAFLARRDFTETYFVPENNRAFGYNRFDYLYLSDDTDINTNLNHLCRAAQAFFTDPE